MDQDKLNTLFHSTTDEKYKKFLCDRGWEFETEAEVKAAYEKQYTTFRKLLSASSKDIPLSETVDCIDKIVVDTGGKIMV